MITEDYVSFETAKLLKEKGFDGICRTAYETITKKHEVEQCSPSSWGRLNQIKRPTLQMAMKWLREVHMLHVDVDPSEGDWNPTVITLEDWTCAEKFGDNIPIQDTYEEACEAAIKYCLENLV